MFPTILHVDLDAFFSYMAILSKYLGFGNYERALKGSDIVISFHHDLGLRWSIFLGNFLRGALSSCCNIVSQMDIAGNSIQLRFKAPLEYLNHDITQSRPVK